MVLFFSATFTICNLRDGVTHLTVIPLDLISNTLGRFTHTLISRTVILSTFDAYSEMFGYRLNRNMNKDYLEVKLFSCLDILQYGRLLRELRIE